MREKSQGISPRARAWCVAAGFLLLAGCTREAEWPPVARDKEAELMIEAARRAVRQYDGWAEVACVATKAGAEWRVEAWRIVYPAARGRRKCVPWAVRSITLDSSGLVTGYRNSL